MSAGWFDNASCQLNSSYKMTNDNDHHLHHSITTSSSSSLADKQGIAIASFLSYSDSTKIPSPSSSFNTNSIRRALSSADMSSLHHNPHPHPHHSVKRVKSSVQLQAAADTGIDQNSKGPAFEEIWSCILSAPKTGSDSAPPYVHPLEKRTASSLSEKSLGICTESLGSETGSDGFSCPPSDQEDSEEEQEEQEPEVRGYNNNNNNNNVEMMGIYKYSNNRGPTSKTSTMVPPPVPVPVRASSFPPPLPSLAHRDEGSNLHIRSHRQDGRLVVQAVAVPSHSFFRAQRQDGRLLLTLSSGHDQKEEEEEEDTDAIEEDNLDQKEEESGDDFQGEELLAAIPREQLGVINVQRSSCAAFAMTKFMELTNKSTWPRNYNTTVSRSLSLNNNEEEVDESGGRASMTQSLPPRRTMSPATAAAVAINAYEYYWRRTNSPVVAMFKPLAGANNNNNKLCAPQVGKDAGRINNRKGGGGALAQEDEVVVVKAAGRRGGGGASTGEYLVPLMLRGCKEPKKPSLLLWEPHCIATS